MDEWTKNYCNCKRCDNKYSLIKRREIIVKEIYLVAILRNICFYMFVINMGLEII